MEDACPWCGEEVPPEEPYESWLEGHVQECEPFMRETYGPDTMWDEVM
jgi:hypothetical protein